MGDTEELTPETYAEEIRRWRPFWRWVRRVRNGSLVTWIVGAIALYFMGGPYQWGSDGLWSFTMVATFTSFVVFATTLRWAWKQDKLDQDVMRLVVLGEANDRLEQGLPPIPERDWSSLGWPSLYPTAPTPEEEAAALRRTVRRLRRGGWAARAGCPVLFLLSAWLGRAESGAVSLIGEACFGGSILAPLLSLALFMWAHVKEISPKTKLPMKWF